MLEKIFLQVLKMSFTASFVILFVFMARIFLQRLPKVFSYALWVVVLFRLICPFSFESMFSLLPVKTNAISQDIIYKTVPTMETGLPAMNSSIQQLLPAATPAASTNPLQIWIAIGTIIWLLGMAILLLYSIASLMKLQKRLKNAVCEKDNIYLVEHLDTPFVMGIIRPKIYLPASLTGEEKGYILLHEQMHIRRFDHLVKIISFFVLCLHWFNPFVWAAFFVSGRDMEMSCDEAVINELGGRIKKEYSSSLLTLATGRHILGGTPLAFGEGDTKRRIKNVLDYKKPAFWMVAVALVLGIIFAGCLISNPRTYANASDFSIEVDGITVELGSSSTLALDKLGSKQIVNEATGEIRTIEDYAGFNLARDSQQKIFHIEILSGNVATHRQITIGSTREAVLAAYPEIIPEEQKLTALWFEDTESIIEFYFLNDSGIVSSINVYRKVIDNALSPSTGVGSTDNEIVSKQKDDEGLTFWVKPDEPPQVIGNTAAIIWLKSFRGAHVPAENRISDYKITKVDVIAGEPKAGIEWEEMAYQYVVRVRYDITTATAEYFNPSDGVSGQGTFEGLFRELCVKAKTTGGGGYQIVSAGTGGGEQEFANP